MNHPSIFWFCSPFVCLKKCLHFVCFFIRFREISSFVWFLSLFTRWEFFTSALAWRSFTWVWVTTLVKFPGLFSVFGPISIMQWFEWSPLVQLFPAPSPFINPLVTVSRATITICIMVTFVFHSLFFFNSLARSSYLYFSSLTFNFTMWSTGTAKPTILQVLSFFFFFFFFFLLIIIRSGRLAQIKWFLCMSKSHWSFCVSFPCTDSGLYIYHLFVWPNFNYLNNSQWITLPIQSCLVS